MIWGFSTISFVFVPFLLSFIFEHCLARFWSRDVNSISWTNTGILSKIPKCCGHFPLVQPIANFEYYRIIKNTKSSIEENLKVFKELTKNISSQQNSEKYEIKQKCIKVAQEFNDNQQKIACVFKKYQEMKIYEAFGQNAPQFVLQTAICLWSDEIEPIQGNLYCF